MLLLLRLLTVDHPSTVLHPLLQSSPNMFIVHPKQILVDIGIVGTVGMAVVVGKRGLVRCRHE